MSRLDRITARARADVGTPAPRRLPCPIMLEAGRTVEREAMETGLSFFRGDGGWL